MLAIIFNSCTGVGEVSCDYSYDAELGPHEIECTPDQWANPTHWRLVNGQIVTIDASVILGQQQIATWGAIKDKRDAIQNGGVEAVVVTGTSKWFQTDADSRMQYLGLKDTARDMLAAGHVMSDALQINGSPVNWKTFDNSFVALTLQNAFDIVAAVKTLDALAFANAEMHRENMLKATDPLAYDYSTGWPAVYVAA